MWQTVGTVILAVLLARMASTFSAANQTTYGDGDGRVYAKSTLSKMNAFSRLWINVKGLWTACLKYLQGHVIHLTRLDVRVESCTLGRSWQARTGVWSGAKKSVGMTPWLWYIRRCT